MHLGLLGQAPYLNQLLYDSPVMIAGGPPPDFRSGKFAFCAGSAMTKSDGPDQCGSDVSWIFIGFRGLSWA